MIAKEEIAEWLKGLQDRICASIEAVDGGGQFKEDLWERPGGGGGRTRVLKGKLIEKGGVNFSAVHGAMPEKIAASLGFTDTEFFATGVSIVMHPQSPMIPIIHMNVRYFETSAGKWWFGGGIDLTPIYVVEEDARFFHQTLASVCDKHEEAYYPWFKQWADDYFYVKHRKETRGIGGIFYDQLNDQEGSSQEELFEFMKDVGETFAPLYVELINRHKAEAYDERQKLWQKLRRGRYVEFNLVWDRGTRFGLDTNGRTESILMSLPPEANWEYNFEPEEDSPEAFTQSKLVKGIDWA